MDDREYSIIAWNVNQYDNKIHKWLEEYIGENNPDIAFLSETKRSASTLSKWLEKFNGYTYIINTHNPTHHHGVAMLIKRDVKYVQEEVNLNISCRGDNKGENPIDGRIISLKLEGKYMLVATYVPNSGYGRNPKNYDYRVNSWDPALQKYLNECDKIYPTIWIGDINVAPLEEDVSNPVKMSQWPGFTDTERVSLVKFLGNEWVDIWRVQHLKERLYSWRGNAVECDTYGLRLDSAIVSRRLMNRITSSFMVTDCPLSDHIPIGINIR